ncbi:hypothetical protein CRYUN_Cryun09bG0213800 [Craigia yunnanensis]
MVQREVNQSGQEEQRNQAKVLGSGAIQYENSAAAMGFANSSNFASSPPSFLVGSSSSCDVMDDDGMENLLSISAQVGFQEIGQSSSVATVLCPSETSNLHYQSGIITVFINGVPTEVPRGPLEMKAMFGEDVVLVHSSGVPVPMNEFGFLLQSLQHGKSYFLVSAFRADCCCKILCFSMILNSHFFFHISFFTSI